jgi:hypothetical protein
MNADIAVEIVGYFASALIVLSITQTSILRLRILGLAGSLTFLVYSIVIGAYPIAVVNVVAAAIHIWYLRQLLRRTDEVFRILHVVPDSSYLIDFLDFYRGEIQGRFQPEFRYSPSDAQVTAFVLRDMVPAGLLIGTPQHDGTFEVELDFVIPQYRDFKIGRFLYSEGSAALAGFAPSCVWATASNPDHAKYLHRMGFTACPDDPDRYEIRLDVAAGAT